MRRISQYTRYATYPELRPSHAPRMDEESNFEFAEGALAKVALIAIGPH